MGEVEERSYEVITLEDLRRLAQIADDVLDDLFTRRPTTLLCPLASGLDSRSDLRWRPEDLRP